jgi:cellulose synthase operon protein C
MRLLSILVAVSLATPVFAYTDAEYLSVRSESERKLAELRKEEYDQIQEALKLRATEKRRAELYFRMGEIAFEQFRNHALEEGKIYESKTLSRQNSKLEKRLSEQDLQQAIAAGEKALELKVDPSKRDRLYYFLGYSFQERGDGVAAKRYFGRLLKEFPSSPLALESEREVADQDFKAGRFKQALERYEKILKSSPNDKGKSRLYARIAWCNYRVSKVDAAIAAMRKSIELAPEGEESLRDLTVFYADAGRVDEAIAYFESRSNGPDRLTRLLEKLGREYERNGQEERAARVYLALGRLKGTDDGRFRTLVKLMDLDLRRARTAGALDRIQAVKSIPYSSSDLETKQAAFHAKAVVRRIALEMHDKFRKDAKDRVSLQLADRAYALYLAVFLPSSDDRAEQNEIRMYLAEVKAELGDARASTELYRKVVEDRDPKYAREAASLWVASLAGELKSKAPEVGKRSEIGALEKQFVSASDILQESIPGAEEAREAQLRSAQLLAAYPESRDDALKRADALWGEYPQSRQAVLAARLSLQLRMEDAARGERLSRTKDWVQKASETSELIATDAAWKGDLGRDLDSAKRQLAVGEITQFEKQKDFSSAAQSYEKYARAAKTPSEAEKAYMGAVGAYAEASESDEIARLMLEWRTRYPNSKLIENSVKSQATKLFIKGLFTEAAELFLGIARLFDDPASYKTAGALFSGALQKEKARAVYRTELKKRRSSEDRARLYALLAETAASVKDDQSELISWRECFVLDTPLQAECGSKLADLYLKIQDPSRARQIFLRVLKRAPGKKSKDSPFLAYAQFGLGRLKERTLTKQKLRLPIKALMSTLNKRIAELKPVTAEYEKAIEYGGPWSIAATDRLMELSYAFAREVDVLLASPQISSEVRSALTPVSRSLRKKAVDIGRKAYGVANRDRVLSSYLPVLHDRLVDFKVRGFYRSQGRALGVRLTGVPPGGGKAGREAALASVRQRLTKSAADAGAWLDYGNLLWGAGRPGLAKVAYQRAFELKKRVADASNNLAVISVTENGLEDWVAANEAKDLWEKAVRLDANNRAAQFNLAHIYNYYRLFRRAKPYVDQLSKSIVAVDMQDMLATTLFGLGKVSEGKLAIQKGDRFGLSADRFEKRFLQATQMKGVACGAQLERLGDLKGFEKSAVDRLKERCK